MNRFLMKRLSQYPFPYHFISEYFTYNPVTRILKRVVGFNILRHDPFFRMIVIGMNETDIIIRNGNKPNMTIKAHQIQTLTGLP